MDAVPIPAGLAERVPELVVLVLLVSVVLAFVWRLWNNQTGFLDKWMSRHEAAEDKQMSVIEKNTAAADRVAAAVGRLSDRIVSGSVFPLHITDEPMDHSIASPRDAFHIGVPGGRFEPDVTFSASYLTQTGETAAWTVARYGIDKLHGAGVKGKGAEVVVIDTGVDPNHQDLRATTDLPSSRSFVPGQSLNDLNSHGTHCGGIIAADDNGVGVFGVAPDATVTYMKGLSNGGSGAGSWLANSIRAAADLPGHRILSCSFGADGEDRQITAAVRYAVGKGQWVFAAAGNSGPGSINWPGALPEVVCVGALDVNDRVARFSSANDFVDVGFGGVQILSTIPGNRYARYDGTSMATPGVAGVAALAVGELLARDLPIPPQSVMTEVLYATCKDVGAPGKDPGAGYGLVQPALFIQRLIEKVQGDQPVDPKPDPEPKPEPSDVLVLDVAKLKADGFKSVSINL